MPESSQDQVGSTPAGAVKPLYCKVMMDKNLGFILEILDANGQHQQSVTLDGTTLIMSVQGPNGVSTITQTANSIALNAKEVTIDADLVRISSRASTSLQSLGQTNISSVSEITLQTPARVSANAMQGVDINAMSLAVSTMQDVSIQAVGGVGIFGVTGGVQLFGSIINTTSLELEMTALTMMLYTTSLDITEPVGGI